MYANCHVSTVQVPLGILLKNENTGIVDILTLLHQYVPVKEYMKKCLFQVLIGGDQLTANSS